MLTYFCRKIIYLIKISFLIIKFFLNFLQPDSGALRQNFQGLGKINSLHFFDKSKNIAMLAAAKTMKTASVRIDHKRGGLLIMERAERLPVDAGFFQLQIRADQVNNINS